MWPDGLFRLMTEATVRPAGRESHGNQDSHTDVPVEVVLS
jgi:hypothetical protein